jgi:hypothetical protein
MRSTYPDILLRLGLAFAFLYPAIDAWFNPFTWLGYVPSFAYILWPWSHLVFLHLFGAAEILLALWVLSGWKIGVPSALMGFLLLLIVVVNPNQFEVVFRDLAIAAAAFALALRHLPHRERSA